MPQTAPNQKTVVIHKERPQSDFLQISNEHWMEFNKKYGSYALAVYLYFAKNADGYSFALSPKAAREAAGITKSTFEKYVKLMIDEGYLVRRNGNTYDFYETPHKQEGVNMRSSPYGGFPSMQNELQNQYGKPGSSAQITGIPLSSIEIDNIHTEKTHNLQIAADSSPWQPKDWESCF